MDENKLVEITKEYYNSQDADEFYHTVWGGEDIHIGIYDGSNTIKEASRETVVQMAEEINHVGEADRILDLGAGYGGAARYLADKYGCHVDCLNLSTTENQRNVEKNRKQGLDHLINVIEGNFEDLPFEDAKYDVVWSQDAILHSNQKYKVFQEASRVLKPGGIFIFTDPMQADDCPEGVLDAVLKRIHLEEMGSMAKYREFADQLGLMEMRTIDMPEQLVNHYSNVLKGLQTHYDKVIENVSKEYADNMQQGLKHWVEAGNQGYLNWGIMKFKKF
ncbi:sarcosine/dimethylglycine N-methyltransferase [Catalinimonas alkaloidigena]|uniref:methyltransferase domain-containing protein n=1 Tax=Catalinimonas alkaloidigena TaxID=1075417 RepID=UPI002406946D|nr:methyltransferase domain-containing protein [Catalinimonas alkaloidigena]MDF9797628.1 sarcosine/dimethylglycine N-methyltransferase [Catalinimonas alkaloidigena]